MLPCSGVCLYTLEGIWRHLTNQAAQCTLIMHLSGHTKGCFVQQGGTVQLGSSGCAPRARGNAPMGLLNAGAKLIIAKTLGQREHPLASSDGLCQDCSYLLLAHRTQAGEKSWPVLGHTGVSAFFGVYPFSLIKDMTSHCKSCLFSDLGPWQGQ